MLRQANKLLIILSFIFLLSACSHIYGEHGLIKGTQTAYLKEHSIAPLRIPPGLSSAEIKNHYPVPDVQYSAAEQNVDLVPPGLNK